MAALDVLLPVKDGMPYLEEAIKSVLGQTFSDFTLLVIDDGSSDQTAEVVTAFAESDSRVNLVSCDGSGLIDALNQGLNLSTSPFIARMDADDVSMPARFERQISYLRTHSDVDVVGCWTELIDQKGQLLGTITEYPGSPTELLHDLFSNKNPLAHPTVMMRGDKVKTLGGYRKALEAAEDFDLWLRVAETGKLANLAEPLLRYRLHPGQVSARRRLAQSFASELAFICSEERRANKTDPVMQMNMAASWQERIFHSETPAVTSLCDRFSIMSEVIETGRYQKDLLRSTLAHIAEIRPSMAINHRLYADVSAMITIRALRRGALAMAFQAFAIGSKKNIRRFLKMSMTYILSPYKMI